MPIIVLSPHGVIMVTVVIVAAANHCEDGSVNEVLKNYQSTCRSQDGGTLIKCQNRHEKFTYHCSSFASDRSWGCSICI